MGSRGVSLLNRSWRFVVPVLTLMVSQARADPDTTAALRVGALKLGVHVVQHSFDAMRQDEVRPARHTDFGGRVDVAYAAMTWLEVAVSGYRGVSHFDFDTAFESGHGRDSDWSVDIGPNVLLGRARSVKVLLGGMFFYGEARSETSIDVQGGSGTVFTIHLEGPRTYMVGGGARLLATMDIVERIEGVLQLSSGVFQAHAQSRASGDLYNWNGGSVALSMGIRIGMLRGRS